MKHQIHTKYVYVHVSTWRLLVVVVWVVTEGLLRLLACGMLGLLPVIFIHAPGLGLAVDKGTGESGTVATVSVNGCSEEG